MCRERKSILPQLYKGGDVSGIISAEGEMEMYSCLRQIKGFVKTAGKNTASLTEMLCLFYAFYYPVDEEKIQEKLDGLESVWKGISRRKQRVLCRMIWELCSEHERTGFLTGVKVGAQMMVEVLDAEENMERR